MLHLPSLICPIISKPLRLGGRIETYPRKTFFHTLGSTFKGLSPYAKGGIVSKVRRSEDKFRGGDEKLRQFSEPRLHLPPERKRSISTRSIARSTFAAARAFLSLPSSRRRTFGANLGTSFSPKRSCSFSSLRIRIFTWVSLVKRCLFLCLSWPPVSHRSKPILYLLTQGI